jgi:AAA domain
VSERRVTLDDFNSVAECANANGHLRVMTARELCQLPDPPADDQLLGPLVERGRRVVLGGHTGEGKTTLALQIVRAVVLGRELLNWRGAGVVRALVLDAEQGLKTIKRRLAEAGLADSELVDYVRVPDGLELDSNEEHVAEVERLVAGGGYALVCADPLYKLHAGDSNAEREAVDLMRRFDAWREAYRFALLLPVHCRKPQPGTRFSIHDLFGSSAYVRGAEVVLGLQRTGDGAALLHWLKDRDGDLPVGTRWRLLFDRERGFRRDPKDGEPATRDRVAELRENDPDMTQAQAATVLGLTERTVRKYWHEDEGDAQESLLE